MLRIPIALIAEAKTTGKIFRSRNALCRPATILSCGISPLSKKTSIRLLYRYETGKIRDWHYDGVAQNPTPSNNQMTFLDSGPMDYNVSVVGLFFGVSY